MHWPCRECSAWPQNCTITRQRWLGCHGTMAQRQHWPWPNSVPANTPHGLKPDWTLVLTAITCLHLAHILPMDAGG